MDFPLNSPLIDRALAAIGSWHPSKEFFHPLSCIRNFLPIDKGILMLQPIHSNLCGSGRFKKIVKTKRSTQKAGMQLSIVVDVS